MAQLTVVVYFLLLLSVLPLFDATRCNTGFYCPVGLDCNKNNSLCEYQMCSRSVGANKTHYDKGFACSSSQPVCKPLPGDMVIIQNFSDPLVIGAACAAVNQITTKGTSTYKSVLVTITNGTRQVTKGVIDLRIVVALSTTCKKDSELCTSVECPIDESTQQLWIASIVAPPALTAQTIKYNVLSVKQIMHIGSVAVHEIDELDFFLCSLCNKVVAYLKSHLDNEISRRVIKEILDSACNNLNFIIRKSCLDFVNKYFDKIWNAVIHKNLGKLCCDFGFCVCKINDTVEYMEGSMYHATSHGDLCPEGFFCLAGDDCSSNSSLCEVGVCQPATEENCIQGITVQFSLNKYEVKENNGPAQLELILSKPLEYCSSSILIKVEDVTATGNRDYEFPRGGYIQVVVSSGTDRVPLNVTVKDDFILERTENFRLSIVDVSLSCGVIVGSRRSAEVVIFDNDRSCVRIDRSTYNFRETLNSQVTLSLSLIASYDISVTVHGADLNAKKYDYDPGPYRVIFKAGNRRAAFRINITDDDIYEGPETFNLYIDTFLPSQVSRCEPYTSTVTILDDERGIRVGFDQSLFSVNEDLGTLSPVITLDRPSPCCLSVHAKLIDNTAIGGGVDYGYPLPIMYEFKFLAGETCATAVDPIPIIDDKISERDETFRFTIIQVSLSFGVQVNRDSATITIKDNDIAVFFVKPTYEIDENKGPVKLRLRLDKSTVTEFKLQVYDVSNTANGIDDYTPGPYYVIFRRNSLISEEFSVSIIPDYNDIYVGNRDFNLTIDEDSLPLHVVPGNPISTKITILDDEYIVCFSQSSYIVEEGRRAELDLSVSKRLSVRVRLIYSNGSGYPATRPPAPRGVEIDYTPRSLVSVYTTTKVVISTRSDSTLEYNETFAVSIEPSLIYDTPAAAHCITTVDVLIVDNDFLSLGFNNRRYSVDESGRATPRVTLMLSSTAVFPITFAVLEIDGTTIGGRNGEPKDKIDYELQHYVVTIPAGQRTSAHLTIDIYDDDIVEPHIEYYHLTISNSSLPDRVSIRNVPTAQIDIRDDDVSTVTQQGNLLSFSKPIAFDTEVSVAYYNGQPLTETHTLQAGDKQVTIDTSRPFRRITIIADSRLERYDFRASASNIYVTIARP